MYYNVTLKLVLVTIVAVGEKILHTVSVCCLGYPAYNVHAPYCHLWSAPLYNIFPHYLVNWTIFEKIII